MIKKILFSLLLTITAAAGFTQSNIKATTVTSDYLFGNERFYMPFRDTTWTPSRNGALTMRPADGMVYVYNASYVGPKWQLVIGSGGGGSVSSVFGRAGAVVADGADYSAFYAALSHTHTLSNLLQSGATNGQVAKWNGSAWAPAADETGGGGSSADSSWVSSETGTQYNELGYIQNTTFSGVLLPAFFTDATPNATVTVNNKLIVSGGANTSVPVLGNAGTSTVYSDRLEAGFYPYDKMRYSMTVIPQDKTATSHGLAIHFKSNSLFFSVAMEIRVDLTNSADSGRIILNYDLGATVAQSPNLSHAAGDTLDIDVLRDTWNIYAKIYNRRTTKTTSVNYVTPSHFGTGGQMYLGLRGGSQHITKFQIYSYNNISDSYTFLGDSQTSGSGATAEEKIYALTSFNNDKNRVNNLSNPSVTLQAMVNSHVPAAIMLGRPVIIMAGFNDRRDLPADTNTFRQRYDSIIQPLQRSGLDVYIATMVPVAGAGANYDLVIKNLAISYNIPIIKIDSLLSGRNYLSTDGIHASDSAQILVSNEIKRVLGSNITTLFSDTTSPVKFHGIKPGKQNMAELVVDIHGNVFKMPRYNFDGILNSKNFNGAGTNGQNAAIHTTGVIVSDSGIIINNRNGLYLGFNGTNIKDTSGAGSNIVMTNAGNSGSGFPQQFGTYPSNGQNYVVQQLSVRPNKGTAGPPSILGGKNFIHTYTGVNMSGTGNLVMQGGSNFALSTGSYNMFFGSQGGGNFTTANYNMAWSNIVDYNGGAASWAANNATGTIMMGTPYDYNGGTLMQNGEVLIASYTRGDRLYTFGPRGGFAGTKITWWPGHQAGSNLTGLPLEIGAMPGTGTGESGAVKIRFAAPGSSGGTLNTYSFTGVQFDRNVTAVFNLIDQSASTRGIIPARWITANRPAAPSAGEQGYNTTDNKMEYWNGTIWVQF